MGEARSASGPRFLGARRRGTSIAAAALSLALVLSGVQSVGPLPATGMQIAGAAEITSPVLQSMWFEDAASQRVSSADSETRKPATLIVELRVPETANAGDTLTFERSIEVDRGEIEDAGDLPQEILDRASERVHDAPFFKAATFDIVDPVANESVARVDVRRDSFTVTFTTAVAAGAGFASSYRVEIPLDSFVWGLHTFITVEEEEQNNKRFSRVDTQNFQLNHGSDQLTSALRVRNTWSTSYGAIATYYDKEEDAAYASNVAGEVDSPAGLVTFASAGQFDVAAADYVRDVVAEVQLPPGFQFDAHFPGLPSISAYKPILNESEAITASSDTKWWGQTIYAPNEEEVVAELEERSRTELVDSRTMRLIIPQVPSGYWIRFTPSRQVRIFTPYTGRSISEEGSVRLVEGGTLNPDAVGTFALSAMPVGGSVHPPTVRRQATVDVFAQDQNASNPTGQTENGRSSRGLSRDTVVPLDGWKSTYSLKITNIGDVDLVDPVVQLPWQDEPSREKLRVRPGQSETLSFSDWGEQNFAPKSVDFSVGFPLTDRVEGSIWVSKGAPRLIAGTEDETVYYGEAPVQLDDRIQNPLSSEDDVQVEGVLTPASSTEEIPLSSVVIDRDGSISVTLDSTDRRDVYVGEAFVRLRSKLDGSELGTIPVTTAFKDVAVQEEEATDTPPETASDRDRLDPVFEDAFVRPGRTARSVPPLATLMLDDEQFNNQPLPVGTTLSTTAANARIVEDDNGQQVVEYTAPADARPGQTIGVPVTVFYPDGSTDHTTVTFRIVAAALAELAELDYEKNKSARPGQTVTVKRLGTAFGDDADIVEFVAATGQDFGGWRVSVDKQTGDLRVTAPQQPSPVTVTIVALFNDGSTKELTANIGAADPTTDAQRYEPAYAEKILRGGETGKNAKPSEARNVARYDIAHDGGLANVAVANDGTVTATMPKAAKPGSRYTVSVKVEYNDESVDFVPAVFVTDSQARAITTDRVSIPPVSRDTASEEQPKLFGELPKETTFDLNSEFNEPDVTVSVDNDTGELTVHPNDNVAPDTEIEIPVVVTLPDQSQKVVTVVTRTKENQRRTYNPAYLAASVDAGKATTISLKQPLPTSAGASFTLVGSVQGVDLLIDEESGTITASAHSSALPGRREIDVAVAYGDGTQETVSAALTVKTVGGKEALSAEEVLKPLILAGQPGAQVAGAIDRPVGAEAADFVLISYGWGARVDTAGVFSARIPADAKPGQRRTFPVEVRYADQSVNTVEVTVNVEAVNAEAEVEIVTETVVETETVEVPGVDNAKGSSVATILPIVLGLLAMIGGAAFALSQNQALIRDLGRQFGIRF